MQHQGKALRKYLLSQSMIAKDLVDKMKKKKINRTPQSIYSQYQKEKISSGMVIDLAAVGINIDEVVKMYNDSQNFDYKERAEYFEAKYNEARDQILQLQQDIIGLIRRK